MKKPCQKAKSGPGFFLATPLRSACSLYLGSFLALFFSVGISPLGLATKTATTTSVMGTSDASVFSSTSTGSIACDFYGSSTPPTIGKPSSSGKSRPPSLVQCLACLKDVDPKYHNVLRVGHNGIVHALPTVDGQPPYSRASLSPLMTLPLQLNLPSASHNATPASPSPTAPSVPVTLDTLTGTAYTNDIPGYVAARAQVVKICRGIVQNAWISAQRSQAPAMSPQLIMDKSDNQTEEGTLGSKSQPRPSEGVPRESIISSVAPGASTIVKTINL